MYDISKMLTQISGLSFPHQKKEKTFIFMYVQVQNPCSPTQAFIFLSVWTLDNTTLFSSNLKRRDSLSKHVYASKAIRSRPRTFDSARLPVIRRVSASISSGDGYFECWLYIVT